MTRLPCLVVAAGCLGLAALPAAAAEGCDAVPELRAAAQSTEVEEITQDKIDALLNDAEGMCEEGKVEDLDIKLRNVRELLESDIEALPDPQPGTEPPLQQKG